MTKSILNLPPILQEVWTAAYQAVIQGEHMALADPAISLLPNMNELANRAEEHAWEAVRRANGGEMPGSGDYVDDDPTRGDALHKFAIIVASAEYGDGWSELALLSKKARVETAKNMLVNPASSSIARVALACHRGKYVCNEKADVTAGEPTSDDMVEALAPIVAELSFGSTSWEQNKPFREAWIKQTRQCLSGIESTWTAEFRQHCAIAIASWKAARAWGRSDVAMLGEEPNVRRVLPERNRP